MLFALSEEEEMIRDTARRMAAERVTPLAEKLDRGEGRSDFIANLKWLAQAGFMTLNVRGDYGGAEAGPVAFALAIEELGYACASTGCTASVTNMVGEVIQAVGSEDQRQKYLPRIASGDYPAAGFCLTEANAGSDPSAMRTTARRDGDGYILDGTKIYITSGEYAGLFVVWAVTDKDAPKGKGISCFLVEADAPGLVIGKAESK
ncbi:MAG: acyl-CoA dehydrogenase family protein, partial [Beijerinckiaceae bacterium]